MSWRLAEPEKGLGMLSATNAVLKNAVCCNGV